MGTYKPGYVEGKVKVGFYLSTDVRQALKVRAAETGEGMSEIAERAIRRELGMMKLTWEVIEDNGGGLHLVVFEGGDVIYYADGLEHHEDGLRDTVAALRNGADPRREGWDLPAWIVDGEHDIQDVYDNLTSYENGWEVVADEDGVYYDRMGAAASRVFGEED